MRLRLSISIVLGLIALACVPALAVAAPPSVEYLGPNQVRNHEATLWFSVDPNGLETTWEFEYGHEAGVYYPNYEMRDETLPAGEEPVLLKVRVPGYWEGEELWAGTEYHWRVVAENADGTTEGADQVFTTTDEPAPVFTIGKATQTGSGSVAFTGTVDPEGVPLTNCRFRYVTKSIFVNVGFEKWAAVDMARFGETVPCAESPEEIGSGTEPVSVHAEVTGLELDEYQVRLEGGNAYEDVYPESSIPFTVSASEEPPASPPVPGNLPPSGTTPPGLTKAPGIKTAPGLHKPRKKKRHRHHRGGVRRNATISARR
jgi:hypothetical protein